MSAFIDLTGQRFGRWTAVRRGANDAFGQARWECVCKCGGVGLVRGGDLKAGQSRSCGCRPHRLPRKRPWPRKKRCLSDGRATELAEWYEHSAYWNYSPNALAAGALDAELRAILRKEVPEQRVEVEFKRVLKASRLSVFPIERGRFPT
jgi:hypothetical protein